MWSRGTQVAIVLVVLLSLGGALYFGTRGRTPQVLDYEKPPELKAPATPPKPPAIFRQKPVFSGICVESDGDYRYDVINVLGHHFLIVYSAGGDVRAAVEFSGNGETHIQQGPGARDKGQGEQKQPELPDPPKAEASP